MGQDCTRKDSITVERLQGQLFPSAGQTLANDNNRSEERRVGKECVP